MDVERIQKINALALDLLKKGLAPDREAAVAQAEQVYRGQGAGAEEYAGFQRRLQETRGEAQNISSQAFSSSSSVSSSAVAAPGPDLAPEKVKDILQQNTNFLVKKIKEFQEKVDALERELAAVKNRMLYTTVPRENSAPVQHPQEAQMRREVPIISASSGAVVHTSESGNGARQEAKAEAPHPRSGSWKQEDVSIEKFFYMGGGKR